MNLLDINDRAGQYPPSFYAHDIDALTNTGAPVGSIRCDVCVIGGGFTGLSTALHLARQGYTVRLLEAQRIGFGASGRNGGQVGQGQRVDQITLEHMFGLQRAKELWDIGVKAVELVRELAADPRVYASFRPGVVHADHKKRFVDHSRRYAAKLQQDYDYPDITFLDKSALQELVNSPVYHGGTLDRRAGHIDPLQFALGLGRMAQDAGAQLHENARVRSVKDGSLVEVQTDQATIHADHVVLACNGYIGGLHNDVASRVVPINSYVVATKRLSVEERVSILAQNYAVADSKFIVNYFRFSDDNRMLFGGTETYSYRFPKDIAAKVRKPMSRVFPQLQETPIEFAWGGTLGITMNRLPHFRRYAGNILSMSGFSGQGVALGTLSGQIAADLIAGQAERFDIMANIPTPRFPGGQALRQPLLMLAMLWYSLRDKL